MKTKGNPEFFLLGLPRDMGGQTQCGLVGQAGRGRIWGSWDQWRAVLWC